MAFIEGTRGGRPLYRVRWNYYTDEGGKKRYEERSFRDRATALRLHREKTAGHTANTETITVAALAGQWFERHVDTDACQLRTRKDYHCHYDKRIAPYLGRKTVARVTAKDIVDWRNWMLQDEKTGPRTVNKTIDALKAMVRWGRGEGLCTNVMIDGARRVKTPRPKPANPHSPETVQRIAAACKYLREETLILVAAYSGLRWSELRALRWVDVDLDTGMIDLSRSLDLDHTIKTTKSDRHRIVPILAPGVEALRRWRPHVPDDVDIVFPTSNGKPLRENGWYGKRLPEIRAACGIHFDLHELRDTYASILIQSSGVREAELTLWLGHRSIQTTIDRYGKLFEKRRATVVSEANASLAHLG